MNTQDNNPYASPQSTGMYATNTEMYPVVSFWWWLGIIFLLGLSSALFFPLALIIALVAIFVTDHKTKKNFFIAYLLKFLIIFIVMIPVFAILAAIALPAYQDYTKRAQVSEAIGSASAIKSEVVEAYENDKPLSSIDTDAFKNKYIDDVKIQDNGTIIITVNEKIDPQQRSFGFVPSIKNNEIHWKCVSNGLPERLLPTECRQAQ